MKIEKKRIMKKKLYIVLLVLGIVSVLALGLATKVMAQAKAGQGVELGDSQDMTAYVVGIDKQDRTISLLGPQGNVVTVEVTEDVRNFDQIEVGDHLKVTYYEAVAVYFGDHGTQPVEDAGLVVARSPEGAKPGVYAVGAVDVSATVQAISRSKGTVTLKGPDGYTHTVTVDKSVKGFRGLRVGDSIHARFTEAIAITVE
jgi:hypothetical protein